mgnify:CR=1 FL=1
MIDVNLLIKPPPVVRWWIVTRTVALVAALAVAGVSTFTGLQEMRLLEASTAEQQALAESFRKVSRRLPEAQARVRAAEKAAAELARIARNQASGQAAVLDLLRPHAGGVWLTEVLFEDAEVMVSGRSDSFAKANAYLLGLRTLQEFEAVAEVELTTTSGGETFFTYLVRLPEEVDAQ